MEKKKKEEEEEGLRRRWRRRRRRRRRIVFPAEKGSEWPITHSVSLKCRCVSSDSYTVSCYAGIQRQERLCCLFFSVRDG